MLLTFDKNYTLLVSLTKSHEFSLLSLFALPMCTYQVQLHIWTVYSISLSVNIPHYHLCHAWYSGVCSWKYIVLLYFFVVYSIMIPCMRIGHWILILLELVTEVFFNMLCSECSFNYFYLTFNINLRKMHSLSTTKTFPVIPIIIDFHVLEHCIHTEQLC